MSHSLRRVAGLDMDLHDLCEHAGPRPRQYPPTAQTRPRKPSPWAGLGLSQQTRGRVVIRETQPKTQMGTRDYPKKQKKLTDHFTLSYAVIFDYLIVSMA